MQDEKPHHKIKVQPFCSEMVGIYRKTPSFGGISVKWYRKQFSLHT